jgi:hypothetical protein
VEDKNAFTAWKGATLLSLLQISINRGLSTAQNLPEWNQVMYRVEQNYLAVSARK